MRTVLGTLAVLLCHSALLARTIPFNETSVIGPQAKLEASLESNDPTSAIEIRFTMGGISVEETQTGYEIHTEGLTPMNKVGYPEMASSGLVIAAPSGTVPHLEILEKQTQWIEGLPIRPCQKKARCSMTAKESAFKKNAKVYESNKPFPRKVTHLELLGQMQDIKLYRFAINPLQSYPRSGNVKATTSLRARVTFTGTAEQTPLPASLLKTLTQVAANGRVLPQLALPLVSPETMIIVVPDELKSAMGPLVEWKRQRGLRVDLISTSEAGTDRDTIRAFLQTKYSQMARKPSFLLLVGNKVSMPGYLEKTDMGLAASDYSYTLLEGNDSIPDVLQGRLLADTEAEVKTQVARWIRYEKNPAGDWFPNASTIASDEGTNPSDEGYALQVSEALSRHTYKKVDHFFQSDATATASKITNALEEGRSWIAYFGHGSGTDWDSTNDRFSVREVEAIKNSQKLPFVVDVACQNGAWMDIAQSFGKTWVTARNSGEDSGAIAYLGGSVNISWHEPATMSVGIARYHFERPVYTLGASVFAGQMYLLEKMGMGQNTLDNLRWYNLFGDPSLIARTDSPMPYRVSQSLQAVDGDVEVRVRTIDDFGSPLGEVDVAVWAPGYREPIAHGKTSASGELVLRVIGTTSLPADTLVTTTGYNLNTYQFPASL
jgi:hypothetical protein